jgi:diguanylate cyclase (GGDEF)-like protein
MRSLWARRKASITTDSLPTTRSVMSSFSAMRLLPQTIAMVCLLVLFSFGAAVITRYAIVLPKLREITAQADRTDLRRVLLAIDAKKLQLTALAYKNAIADSTYEYFDAHDANFLDENFPIDTLITFNIDLIGLFDRHNNLVEQRVIDPASSSFSDKTLPVQDIAPYLINLDKVRPHAPIFDSGLMATALGPQLYAVASVMRTDTDSAARGNLLLGIALDEEFVNDIEETAQVHIALAPLPVAARDTIVEQTLEQMYRDDTDQMSWLLTDNAKRPIAKMILDLPTRDNEEDLWVLPLVFAFIVGALGGIGILILFRQLLIKPIISIVEHLQNVRARADYNLRLNSRQGNEIGDLSRGIDAVVTQVQQQQDQLQAQSVELQRLSYNDGLTGLANRRRFDQALTINWALAQRNQTPLALLMCDVDYFKRYNDHYGHLRGDEALRKVAAIIKRIITRQSDVAARYGGEEFAILLPDTDEAGAHGIAERLQKELLAAAIPHADSQTSPLLTASIGIGSITPTSQQQPRELIQRADEALYAAKAAGRNCIMLASQISR